MKRLTTSSIVVGAGAGNGCATGADCASAGCEAGADAAVGCDDCDPRDASGADAGAGDCVFAACCAAALSDTSNAAVTIQFVERMTLSPGLNDPNRFFLLQHPNQTSPATSSTPAGTSREPLPLSRPAGCTEEPA